MYLMTLLNFISRVTFQYQPTAFGDILFNGLGIILPKNLLTLMSVHRKIESFNDAVRQNQQGPFWLVSVLHIP